jgi:predicted RND superfamily exporter protein
MKSSESIFRSYTRFILGHARAVLVVTALVTLVLAIALTRMRLIVDIDEGAPAGHPNVEAYHRVEKKFGEKDLVIVAFKRESGGSILAPDTVRMIRDATAEIRMLPGVNKANLLSIASPKTKDIVGSGEGLDVKAFVPRGSLPDGAALDAKLLRNPVYQRLLVSDDRAAATIIVDYRKLGTETYNSRERDLRAAVERHLLPGVSYGLSGMPVMLARVNFYSERLKIYFGIALLIVALIHFYSFRTLQGMLLPLLTALLAVIWATGGLALLGFNLNSATAPTPILLLAVAAGHAVQILKRYYEEFERLRDNRKAIEEAMLKVGPVMVLAGVIAALSFGSLMTFRIGAIRLFGLYSSLGILAALVIELTFTPALRSLLPAPSPRPHGDLLISGLLQMISAAVLNRRARGFILTACVLAVAGLGFAARLVKVDNEQKQYFPYDDPYLVADRWIVQAFGGTDSLSVLVEGPENGVKRPQVMEGIARIQAEMERDPAVGKTLSIADFVKKMNQEMHGGSPKEYLIPASSDLIAQYLLLYSMGGDPDDFDSYVTPSYDSANVMAFLKDGSSAKGELLMERVRKVAAEALPPDTQVSFSGSLPVISAVNEVMVKGKIQNIIQLFLIVAVLGTLVLRSLVGGLLLSLPIMLTVVTNFGLMGLLGYRLDIATSIVSALAVGIGVDYSIYFVSRLREEMVLSENRWETALEAALIHGGEGILLVSLAISMGYFALCLSPFALHRDMGFLVGVSMIVSSFSSITLLPALLLVIRPRFAMASLAVAPARARAPEAIAAGLCGLVLLSPHAVFAGAPTADEIMAKVYAQGSYERSSEELTMELVREDGEKTVRKFHVLSAVKPDGHDRKRLMVFRTPADVKGTAVLIDEDSAKGDAVWVYLPALRKKRRLPGSGKQETFVGSDFTYGNLITPRLAEFKHKILSEGACPGDAAHSCWELEHLPASPAVRDERGISYYKDWVRKDCFVPVRMEVKDTDGQPWKLAVATDVKLIDPKRSLWQPMNVDMENVQTHHRTRLLWESLDVTAPVPSAKLSASHLDEAD